MRAIKSYTKEYGSSPVLWIGCGNEGCSPLRHYAPWVRGDISTNTKQMKKKKTINKNKITIEIPQEGINGLSVKTENYSVEIALDSSPCTWAHDHVCAIIHLIQQLERDCLEQKLSKHSIQLEYIRNLFEIMENDMSENSSYGELVEIKND